MENKALIKFNCIDNFDKEEYQFYLLCDNSEVESRIEKEMKLSTEIIDTQVYYQLPIKDVVYFK